MQGLSPGGLYGNPNSNSVVFSTCMTGSTKSQRSKLPIPIDIKDVRSSAAFSEFKTIQDKSFYVDQTFKTDEDYKI